MSTQTITALVLSVSLLMPSAALSKSNLIKESQVINAFTPTCNPPPVGTGGSSPSRDGH